MLLRKTAFFFFAILLWVQCAYTQKSLTDTVIQLENIPVVSSKLESYAIGATIHKIDTTDIQFYKNSSLSDLLSKTGGVQVNSYGIGGLSNFSIRGGSTSHSTVLWNDLNIQSPMNGGVNLGLMPVCLFNNVQVQHGGAGTLYGNGAVTGAVHISNNNLLNENNSIEFQTAYGSFNNQAYGISGKIGNKKYASSLKLYRQSADNDFPFYNTAQYNDPKMNQTNAGLLQYNALQENVFCLSKNLKLNTSFWYQYYDKDIQTLMSDTKENNTSQLDKNHLASIRLEYRKSKHNLKYRAGYMHYNSLYTEPDLLDPEADNKSVSYIQEIDDTYIINEHHLIHSGVNFTNESAFSDGYRAGKTRNRISLYTTYKLNNLFDKFNAVASLRAEAINGEFIPIVYSSGFDLLPVSWLKIHGNYSKNYRLPTLNDLYWDSGKYAQGNPNLEPEDGWTGEFGTSQKIKTSHFELNFSQVGFCSEINNQIMWLADKSGIWRSYNKKLGQSWGFESGTDIIYKIQDKRIQLHGFYTFTRSKLKSNDNYNNRPMIYMPEHQFSSSISYMGKYFEIKIQNNYMDDRFYDYKHHIEAYAITDVIIQINKQLKKADCYLTFKANNIFSERYQVMAWYAMPLRNYLVSLSIKFNNKQ